MQDTDKQLAKYLPPPPRPLISLQNIIRLLTSPLISLHILQQSLPILRPRPRTLHALISTIVRDLRETLMEEDIGDAERFRDNCRPGGYRSKPMEQECKKKNDINAKQQIERTLSEDFTRTALLCQLTAGCIVEAFENDLREETFTCATATYRLTLSHATHAFDV